MKQFIPTKVFLVAGLVGLCAILAIVWKQTNSPAPVYMPASSTPQVSVSSTPAPAATSTIAATPAPAKNPAPTPTPAPASPPASILATGISIGNDFTGLSDDQLNAELTDMKSLGVSYVRFDLDWSVVERHQGQDNWSVPDRIVAAALAHGLIPLPILDFTPGWARLGACADTNRCEPADPEDYATFAYAAAERYAPLGVHDWEIWNEPNDMLFWAPAPDADVYSQMLQESYRAIKNVDPASTIVVGGLAAVNSSNGDIPPLQFLTELYNTGAGGHFDAVGFHPYSFPQLPSDSSPGNPWGEIASTNPSLRSIMTQNGDGNKQIWITEYGAPTGGPQGVSEARQAQIIADAFAQIKNASWAGPLFIYTYQDAGTGQSTSENFYGLLRYDGSQKPSYQAFKDALTQ